MKDEYDENIKELRPGYRTNYSAVDGCLMGNYAV
jgi:hypothetical protein